MQRFNEKFNHQHPEFPSLGAKIRLHLNRRLMICVFNTLYLLLNKNTNGAPSSKHLSGLLEGEKLVRISILLLDGQTKIGKNLLMNKPQPPTQSQTYVHTKV